MPRAKRLYGSVSRLNFDRYLNFRRTHAADAALSRWVEIAGFRVNSNARQWLLVIRPFI